MFATPLQNQFANWALEGAGAHQETPNRALAETRILDWLDETLF